MRDHRSGWTAFTLCGEATGLSGWLRLQLALW
jgi:hypothetical protein